MRSEPAAFWIILFIAIAEALIIILALAGAIHLG